MDVVDGGVTEGYAPVNGVRMYWRSTGEGGTPLVVVHGGLGVVEMFGDVLDRLAEHRRVIAVELQGHGRTPDVDRPFGFEAFGDDLGALIEHPRLVRRLIVVAAPCRRDGWYPEGLEGMAQVGSALFDQIRHSPMYAAYAAVAPDVDAYPQLMDRTGALLRQPYDWSAEVAQLTAPTLLVHADADSVPTSHAAEFFALLGGGLHDAGWDGAGRPRGGLAILPGRTHYDVFEAPQLAAVAADFLDAPART